MNRINHTRNKKAGARKTAPLPDIKKFFRRSRRNLGLLLILAGILLISYALFSRWYSGYRQAKLVLQYENSCREAVSAENAHGPRDSGPPVQAGRVPASPAVSPGWAEPQAEEPTDARDIALLGVLRIPKIDLSVAIGESTDNRTLKYAAGHFAGTSLPGDTGNCCIAGHRSYTWGSFFSRLDELEAGNEILVDRSGITYTYIVEETFVVAPEDTWVLSETEDARITLITCTPVRVATHRLIVRAVLTGD